MGKKWLVAILVLFGLLISIPSFAEEGKEPVCRLNLDQGEGLIVKDASGNNNDGQILSEGKNTKWVEGKVGKALEFTGDNNINNNGCVSVKSLYKYDFTKGMTVEAWVNLNDKNKGIETCEIISNTESDLGKGFRFKVFWNMLVYGGSVFGRRWYYRKNLGRKFKPCQKSD